MKKGSTRTVLFIGKYAIKLPRTNKWKVFLRGILANIDENMWYKNSPNEWRDKMSPVVFSLAGIIMVSMRANPITDEEYKNINIKDFKPLPVDNKQINFGKYKDRIVLVDYADSKYFCDDCDKCFKTIKKMCKKS